MILRVQTRVKVKTIIDYNQPYQEMWINFENKSCCPLAKKCPHKAFFKQWRQHLGNEMELHIYPPLFTDPEGDGCFSIY